MSVKVVVRKSKETVEQLTADIVSQIPGASPLNIKNLSPDTLNEKYFIKGKIHSLWDLHKTRTRSHRKLVLQDTDGSTINVFLYEEFAEDFNNAKKEDTVLLHNFKLEESSQYGTSHHKYQVVVQAGQEVPKLWLITEEVVSRNAAPSGSKSKTRKYVYTALGDVKPNTTVDVFGVVKFLKPPKQTRGTDLILIVSLIDPSLHEQDQKLKCVLFVKPNKVPKIEVGNVVRFHRLKIGTHQGELQGGTSAGFSWLVFPSPDADPHSSTPNFTYTDEDKKKVKELFGWSAVQEEPISDSTCMLSDIAVSAYFNLTCQVVSTCVIEDGVCFLMRVWDGTKPIYPVRELDTDRDECLVQFDSDLVCRASGFVYDVCAFDDHFIAASRVKPGMFIKLYNLHAAPYKNLETREDLTALPTVELVLHRGTMFGRGMLILDNQSQEVAKLKTKLDSLPSLDNPQPSTSGCKEQPRRSSRRVSTSGNNGHDSWTDSDGDVELRLKNGCKTTNGKEKSTKKCGSVGESNDSGSCIMNMDIQLSQDILGSQFSDEPRCMQETATVILNHPHVKRTKIRDVLQHSVPYKFRVKARVLDCYPMSSTATQFISIFCNKCHFMCRLCDFEKKLNEKLKSNTIDGSSFLCPTCGGGQDVELTYMLRLLLHDGTGWLVANLWRTEADKFFKDITAVEALTDPRSFTEVKDFLTLICPVDRDIVEKPWVECCVASYMTTTGVNYHVFDTVVA